MKHLFGCEDDGHLAVILSGREVEISGPSCTRRTISEIERFLEEQSASLSLPLAFVHTGSAVNWSDDADEKIEEFTKGLLGVVVATNGGEELRLKKESLASAPRPPDEFFAAFERRLGLATSAPGLYFAPSGWAVAELRTSDSVYDGFHAGNETYEGGKVLLTACSEDFDLPPTIDLDALPDEFVLFATYA